MARQEVVVVALQARRGHLRRASARLVRRLRLVGRHEAVRKVLSWRAQAGTVDGVAAHLAAEAVARGNNDNCSVVVVEFVWSAEG